MKVGLIYGSSLHGIKTRYAYNFPLCFPHELLMSLIRNVHNLHTLEYSKILSAFKPILLIEQF